MSAWLDEGLDKPGGGGRGAGGAGRGNSSGGGGGWYVESGGGGYPSGGGYESGSSPLSNFGAGGRYGPQGQPGGGGQQQGGPYGRTLSSTSLTESVSASSNGGMDAGGAESSFIIETKRKVGVWLVNVLAAAWRRGRD